MNKLFDILPPFSDKPLPRIDVKATLKMYPPDKYKEIKQLIDLISQHEERKNKIEESEKLSFSGKMQTSGPLFPRFTTLQVGFSTPQITSPFVNTSQTWPTLTYEQATALAKKQEELEKQKADSEMKIDYGCSHFLGWDRDYVLRGNTPFICGAGTFVGCVLSNGDIFVL